MSFDRSSVSDATLVSGGFGLATPGQRRQLDQRRRAGTWAERQPSCSAPGTRATGSATFGVDPATNTAWAVVNHAGRFAVARF
jgi:hypothetical protein